MSPVVGEWVKTIADKRNDANYEIVDIKDYQLPLLGEKDAPGIAKWNEKLAELDGFVFIFLEREDTFLKCVSTRWVMNRLF